MKTMLILTGPQGSGNHFFSKIFSQHPAVCGWQELLDTYWVGHDQEPFADLWRDPHLIPSYDWSHYDYYVTSISCPYRDNGRDAWPKYKEFIAGLQRWGICVKLAIIGRDQNILEFQEQRLRDKVTYPDFLDRLPELLTYDPVFISQELTYLYKEDYIKSVGQQLDFPVEFNPVVVQEDANKKYLQPVESNWLDPLIRHASKQ